MKQAEVKCKMPESRTPEGESEPIFLICRYSNHTTTSHAPQRNCSQKLQQSSSSSSSIVNMDTTTHALLPPSFPNRPPLRRSTPKMIVEIILLRKLLLVCPIGTNFPNQYFLLNSTLKSCCHPKLIGGYHVEFSSIRLPKSCPTTPCKANSSAAVEVQHSNVRNAIAPCISPHW